VGAGIVAEGDREREWYESLHKAQAQLVALNMLNLEGDQLLSPPHTFTDWKYGAKVLRHRQCSKQLHLTVSN
jgi:hypothetical protein